MRVNLNFEIPNWTKWLVGAGTASVVLGAAAIGLADAVSVPNKFENDRVLRAEELNENFEALQNAVNEATPPGTVVAFAGNQAPKGWLICDGSAVSRAQYPGLFAAIAVTYGAGDSTSTFNLPDLRAAVIRGAGTSTKFTSNAKVGLGQLVDDQMQGHVHLDEGHSHTNGAKDMNLLVPKGDFYGHYMNPSATDSGHAKLGPPSTDGANGSPRTGTETTGKALGLNYIIRY